MRDGDSGGGSGRSSAYTRDGLGGSGASAVGDEIRFWTNAEWVCLLRQQWAERRPARAAAAGLKCPRARCKNRDRRRSAKRRRRGGGQKPEKGRNNNNDNNSNSNNNTAARLSAPTPQTVVVSSVSTTARPLSDDNRARTVVVHTRTHRPTPTPAINNNNYYTRVSHTTTIRF